MYDNCIKCGTLAVLCLGAKCDNCCPLCKADAMNATLVKRILFDEHGISADTANAMIIIATDLGSINLTRGSAEPITLTVKDGAFYLSPPPRVI